MKGSNEESINRSKFNITAILLAERESTDSTLLSF